MLETQSTRPPARAPAAAEVTALLAIVSGVAAVMRPLAQVRLLDPWASALAVGFAAAVIGVPVLVFALEHGRTRVGGLVLLGGIAGALPPVLLLCSGALGLYSRHGALVRARGPRARRLDTRLRPPELARLRPPRGPVRPDWHHQCRHLLAGAAAPARPALGRLARQLRRAPGRGRSGLADRVTRSRSPPRRPERLECAHCGFAAARNPPCRRRHRLVHGRRPPAASVPVGRQPTDPPARRRNRGAGLPARRRQDQDHPGRDHPAGPQPARVRGHRGHARVDCR